MATKKKTQKTQKATTSPFLDKLSALKRDLAIKLDSVRDEMDTLERKVQDYENALDNLYVAIDAISQYEEN